MAYPPPPYADAVCGTHVCGEAICGTWWAYPQAAGHRLGVEPPQLVIPIETPAAGLRLGAVVPTISIGTLVEVPPAGLALGADEPTFATTSTLQPPAAGLGFGGVVPDWAAQAWLTTAACADLPLVPDAEQALVLAPDIERDLVLATEECR